MITPEIPANEKERIRALEEYDVLDTPPEQGFDDITKIAAEICQTPISLVVLIDKERQWFKSNLGLDGATETPRELAFCAHAINKPNEPLIVNDASQDERFANNPLSAGPPYVIFYTGVPLVTPDGYAMGTLCVVDHQPRELSEKQLETLEALSHQVVSQLELRKKIIQLKKVNRDMDLLNKNLSEFSYRLSHDLKSSIRGIHSLTRFLIEDYQSKIDSRGVEYLNSISTRTNKLEVLIEGVMKYSKGTLKRPDLTNKIDITDLIEEVIADCNVPDNFTISYPKDHRIIHHFKTGFYQILYNLVSNAVNFNDKENGRVSITFEEAKRGYSLIVSDNGPGIPEMHHNKVFELFYIIESRKNSKSGAGVGLSTVRSIVEKLNGTIEIQDTASTAVGVSFVISIPKS